MSTRCAAHRVKRQLPRPSMISRFWERVRHFEQQNTDAAEIIVRDVNRYGGETSGLVMWAQLTLARAAERRSA
jgi:hypothetical protein